MQKLSVPVFKQGKNTCGATALRMLFAYFGKNVREQEIIKAAGGVKKFGIRTIKLAEVAKKSGYKTKMFSYNRKLAKGKAVIKKPAKADILKFLKKGIPVMLAVRSFMLYNKKESETGHFIVITNYKNGIFYYNDPLDGKQKRITEKKLLPAWKANIADSSAYLLATWR